MARTSTKPRTVALDVDRIASSAPRQWSWPWYLIAALGPVVVLLAGWLVLAGVATVGWLTSPDSTFPAALNLAARMLLLANGGAVEIGAIPVSIAPLGVSALLMLLSVPIASFAARQAAGQSTGPDDTGRLWVDGESVAWRVGGVFAGAYTAGVLILAAAIRSLSLTALLGALAIGVVSGLWGAAHGLGYDPTAAWSPRLRCLPRAVGAALLLVLAGGSLALGVAVWGSREQITAIVTSLGGGPSAAFLLVVLHLAYLPNFVLTGVSWMLGAGFTVGDGSQITLLTSDVGLLPAIPIFGAVPAGSNANLWWLAVGVLAGALAGLIVALSLPDGRFDETAIVAGAAGVIAGGLIVVGCALGSGALGVARLAYLGARLPALALFAPATLGLSSLTVGLVFGLIRRARATREPVGLDE